MVDRLLIVATQTEFNGGIQLIMREEQPVGLLDVDQIVEDRHRFDSNLAKYLTQCIDEGLAFSVRPHAEDAAFGQVTFCAAQAVRCIKLSVRRAEVFVR